jgi:hypothetical protein
VTNAGAGVFRLLAITSAGALRTSGDDRSSLPGVMEIRSTWFRQSRIHLPPGSMTGWFASTRPVLVVQPLGSGLNVQCGGGARIPLEGAGGWFLVPTQWRCRIHNEGIESATAMAIEVR